MKTKEEILDALSCFTGTEHYYLHPFGIKFSDGCKYLAESAECYWLLDIVASYQFDISVKNEEFQVFKLKVNDDHSAVVEITDGNHNVLATQELEFTDFPLDEIELWCIDKVCILPSEY
ncbi:hypothetical protein MASR1M45_02600 [Candidatus Kapaibacterium sp.]